MMKKIIQSLALISIALSSSGCFYDKKTRLYTPVFTFGKYELPAKVPLLVKRECTSRNIQIGDCVRRGDATKLIARARLLEGIIYNLESDIKQYQQLVKPKDETTVWKKLF